MTEPDGLAERKRLEAVRDASAPVPAETPEPSPLKRTATKEITWKAWAGSIKDLHLINARFEKQVEARRDELLRDAEDEYSRRRIERDCSSRVTLRVNDQDVSGDFNQLIEELDPRTWRILVWTWGDEYGGGGEWVRVEIVNFDHVGALGDVVRVRVKSADPGFVASTVSSLREVIDLSKPRWGWVHTKGGRTLVSVLVGFGVEAAALLILRYFGVRFLKNPVASWLMAGLWVVNFGMWAHLLLPKVVSPVEIRYDTAAKSQGSSFLGVALGVLVLPFLLSLIFWLLPPR